MLFNSSNPKGVFNHFWDQTWYLLYYRTKYAVFSWLYAWHVILLLYLYKKGKKLTVLLCNSENLEHPKYFRNVGYALTNQKKVQNTQANLKPQSNYRYCLWSSFLTPVWLFSCITITLHKHFCILFIWCSRFYELHSNTPLP